MENPTSTTLTTTSKKTRAGQSSVNKAEDC